MALNLQEQQEYNKLIQEGISLAEKLGDAALKVTFQNMPIALNASEKELTKIQLEVETLRDEWKHFVNDVSGSRQQFVNIVEQIKNTVEGVNLANKAFNGLSSIAQKVLNIQSGAYDLTAKELRVLKEKALSKISELNFAAKTLELNESNLKKEISASKKRGEDVTNLEKKLKQVQTAQSKINEQLGEGVHFHEALIESIEIEAQKAEILNNKIGLTGAILRGLSKIPIIGDAINTDKALEAAKNRAKETGSSFSAMGAGLKSVAGDLKNIAKDPLTIMITLGAMFLKTLMEVDKQTGDLAKSFNITYSEANKLRGELLEIANETGDINVTTKGLQESLTAVGNALYSNATLNKEDLVTMTKLREQAKLSNEELVSMEKLTLATGGNLESNVKNLLYAAKTTALNNGVLLNEKQLMNEVAKTSNATKLSLGGSAENLGRAVAQAKALGMSLEQVDKIAESLLNFESSITSELEAELLTGKELNLEQARLYAINNDMEGVSREIAKNFGSVAEFSKMNRIQQEAAAKAVGMSREELASTLTDQAALKGLSEKQAEQAKAALADARARGMTEEEIKKKGIDGLMAQQSVQERLNASVEKLKEIFVSLAEPLMPVLDVLADVLKVVGLLVEGFGGIMSIGGKISSMFGEFGKVAGTTLKLLILGAGSLAAMWAYASAAAIPIVGVVAGPLAAAAVLAFSAGLASKIKIANDMVNAPPGYGKRTLMGPEGAIALNDKDTVIAGTNLFDSKSENLNQAKGVSESPASKQIIEVKQENNGETKISDVRKEADIKQQQEIEQVKATAIQSASSNGSSVDMSPLVNELQSVKAILNQILNKEGSVYLDSTKVGSAINVGTSKIQ